MFKTLFRNIKNIFRWLPIIYKDRDWNPHFVYVILKKKFEFMKQYQEKYGHALNSQYTAQRINTVIKILDRIIEDDFHNEDFWKDVKHEWIPIENGKYFEMKTVSKYSKKEINEQMEKEDNLRKKYIKTFYSLMQKRLNTFWD